MAANLWAQGISGPHKWHDKRDNSGTDLTDPEWDNNNLKERIGLGLESKMAFLCPWRAEPFKKTMVTVGALVLFCIPENLLQKKQFLFIGYL